MMLKFGRTKRDKLVPGAEQQVMQQMDMDNSQEQTEEQPAPSRGSDKHPLFEKLNSVRQLTHKLNLKDSTPLYPFFSLPDLMLRPTTTLEIYGTCFFDPIPANYKGKTESHFKLANTGGLGTLFNIEPEYILGENIRMDILYTGTPIIKADKQAEYKHPQSNNASLQNHICCVVRISGNLPKSLSDRGYARLGFACTAICSKLIPISQIATETTPTSSDKKQNGITEICTIVGDDIIGTSDALQIHVIREITIRATAARRRPPPAATFTRRKNFSRRKRRRWSGFSSTRS
jgi:hypothetical protein